jgi:hypothetical protein
MTEAEIISETLVCTFVVTCLIAREDFSLIKVESNVRYILLPLSGPKLTVLMNKAVSTTKTSVNFNY